MSLKAFIPLVIVLAVAAGFALPTPHGAEAEPVSQVQMLDLDQ